MSQDQQPHKAKSTFIPWLIAFLAIIGAVIVLYQSRMLSNNIQNKPNSSSNNGQEMEALHAEITKIKQRLVASEKLVTEIADLERVLSDAQSALAERDREIAAAQAEIKALKSSPSATTSSSLADQLSSYLKQQHTPHLLMLMKERNIGLVISATEQQAVLLLCQPFPTEDNGAGLELWSLSPQPQRLAVITSTTTAFTWPANVSINTPISLHWASGDQAPGPAFAHSTQVTFSK